MNIQALIGQLLIKNPAVTQRELAEALGISLGNVNKQLKEMLASGLIAANEGSYTLTEEGMRFMESFKVDNAIITAAGFGSRFVPLTYEMPKGLLEVFGERMIERQIKQLHEAGITDITIVVGYLKEKFEYLIDKYGVKLVYNPEYTCKNSLATLYHVRHLLKNTYILASDNWLRSNLYHAYEPAAWYSGAYKEGKTSEWCLITDRRWRITGVTVGGSDSYVMYGPAYFDRNFSERFRTLLEQYYEAPGTEDFYWEQIVKDHISELNMYCNRQPDDTVYEFENLEELRLFDTKYQKQSDNAALECISRIFRVPENEITGLKCLKAGMTNKSFLFSVKGSKYIFRIPGPGTDLLINRAQEKVCYDTIAPLGIADEIIYFDGKSGSKITRYYEGSRNADPKKPDDVARCMRFLRAFHQHKLSVPHEFNLRERIGFYEKLCLEHNGIQFEDYGEVRARMNELLALLDDINAPKQLSHIDSVCANFLFLADDSIRLIDWEYAGMCDPLADISAFAIYSYYDEQQTDRLIDMYFERPVSKEERIRIYAYVALIGFLWALWAEYKSALGEEFGEYTIIQYRYGKTYYKKVKELLD